MSSDKLELEERFYANHKLDKEVALAEYNLAARKIDGEEKAFVWVTNIISLLIPAAWYFGFEKINEISEKNINEASNIVYIYSTLYIVFCLFATAHIAYLIKSKVFSERKIILIRRSLGVKYGMNSFVLPSWRLEGADNPFGIKIFPGYLSYSIFPIYLLSFFGFFSAIFLLNHHNVLTILNAIYAFLICLIPNILYFRYLLREQNENTLLWFAIIISRIIKMPIVKNIEYVIYRCRLEISEANRIKANTDIIKPIAVSIEDKEFYLHFGVNIRGIGRAILNFLRYGTKTGGSSITQQFVRTNFLLSLKPTWKRKIIEILLSIWIETVLSKEEILRGYLTTARFDDKIFGFHRASRHFFNRLPEAITKAHAFILVERLANINGLFIGSRVQAILERLLNERILTVDDIYKSLRFYDSMIANHIIRQHGEITPIKIEKYFRKKY